MSYSNRGNASNDFVPLFLSSNSANVDFVLCLRLIPLPTLFASKYVTWY